MKKDRGISKLRMYEGWGEACGLRAEIPEQSSRAQEIQSCEFVRTKADGANPGRDIAIKSSAYHPTVGLDLADEYLANIWLSRKSPPGGKGSNGG